MARFMSVFSLLWMLALASGCGVQKPAAEQALLAAETAYAEISAEAQSVAPDGAAEVEQALTSARALFADGKFGDITQAAPELMTRIESLGRTLPEERARLEGEWQELAKAVSGSIATLERRLVDFGEPPAGMPERVRYDAARAKLEDVRKRWAEAEALSKTGLAKAVAQADQLRYDAANALTEFQQQGS